MKKEQTSVTPEGHLTTHPFMSQPRPPPRRHKPLLLCIRQALGPSNHHPWSWATSHAFSSDICREGKASAEPGMGRWTGWPELSAWIRSTYTLLDHFLPGKVQHYSWPVPKRMLLLPPCASSSSASTGPSRRGDMGAGCVCPSSPALATSTLIPTGLDHDGYKSKTTPFYRLSCGHHADTGKILPSALSF